MKFINFEKLNESGADIKSAYQIKEPFRYTVIENFLYEAQAEEVFSHFPSISEGEWDGTTYIDQRNKFQKTKFDDNPVIADVFQELNSSEFIKFLEYLTDIPDILADDELVGGGLHQSIKGAFLNVHVDYNVHPYTKLHRRLNVLVYMNKNWKPEYEGLLELWDLTEGKRKLLEQINPNFNRCVIFETNEVSFHGHPKALNTPDGISRKSIATYYYTNTRPENELAEEHSTLYVNTEGTAGQLRRFNSGIKAALERINKKQ